jgi:ABC-2 type transport system permease protein
LAGVKINTGLHVLPLLIYYLCFIFTCFGLGLIGASNFFNLEVKQGREPFTWAVDVLARIFGGIYYPLAILPAGLHIISRFIPHTYALEGLRLIMLNGYGLENNIVRNNMIIMICFAICSLSLGVILLGRALDKAYKGNGVGMVV